MSKVQTIILVIITVGVIGFLIYTGVQQGVFTPATQTPENGEEVGEPMGQAEVTGGSLVNDEGQVVTPEGEPARNDVEPGSPEAPQQSGPLSETEVPSSAIKVNVSAAGFDPAEFTVKAGAAVTLSVTSIDTQTHIFKFRDAALSAVAVGIGPGETRAITFNAPSQKGSYEFYCDVPGHAARGEVGTMIVN